MLSSNMLLLNLILLIAVTFSTATGDYTQNPSVSALTQATDSCAVALTRKIRSKRYHLSVTDGGKNSIISQHTTAYKPLKSNGTG